MLELKEGVVGVIRRLGCTEDAHWRRQGGWLGCWPMLSFRIAQTAGNEVCICSTKCSCAASGAWTLVSNGSLMSPVSCHGWIGGGAIKHEAIDESTL
jgi:hypothetical protein